MKELKLKNVKILLVAFFTIFLMPLVSASGIDSIGVGGNTSASPGNNITMSIQVVNMDNIGSLQLDLLYNASVINATGVEQGSAASGALFSSNIDNLAGKVTVGIISISGLSGSGSIADINFSVIGSEGSTGPLDITVVDLTDPVNAPVDTWPDVTNGTFYVFDTTPPTIEIWTNETDYTTGDTMNVGLNITNPGNARTVDLYVWLDLPGGGKEWFLQEPSFTLPAGLNYSNPAFMTFILPSISPGDYAWHAVLYDPVVSEIISESIEPWTFEPKPSIEIYTNETNYTTGDTMDVGLNITNPGNARTVGLYVWLDLPGGGKEWFLQEPSFTLPAGLDYSNPAFMTFILPSIPSGDYAWHAVLYDPVVSEIISESIKPWTFSSTAEGSGEALEKVLQKISIDIDFAE